MDIPAEYVHMRLTPGFFQVLYVGKRLIIEWFPILHISIAGGKISVICSP